MKQKMSKHQPVLLQEVLENLNIRSDGIYVDATLGRAGHAKAILDRLDSRGKLFAFDKDPDAIAFAQQTFAKDKRLTITHQSFSELKNVLMQCQVFGNVDGILFDLGVSSPQLDEADRGFSFMRDGKLDMRMDHSQGLSAVDWIATATETELANVIWEFGEEKFSRRIAHAIVEKRAEKPIISTLQLATIISDALPKRRVPGKHPATQSFQAIRMFINQELEHLQKGLEQAYHALNRGGRLLVISFHSLEDRLVKRFIHHYERGESVPAKLPIKNQHRPMKLKSLGRIKPSVEEVAMNPRSRSAVLRIAEKLS